MPNVAPPLKTQQRHVLVFFLVFAQVLLLCLLLPATRSEALRFLVELAGMFLNLVIGMLLYLRLSQNQGLLSGAVLYSLVAFVLTGIEMLIMFTLGVNLRKFPMVTTGLFYPLILPVMLGVMQRRPHSPRNTTPEPGEAERLRNRNGV